MAPPHLDAKREVYVIISTHSGQHTAEGYFHNTLSSFLEREGVAHKTFFTQSDRTIIELTEKIFIPNACKGVKQTIILLSGDGGVIDIVNTIATSLQRTADDHRLPSIFVKPVVALFPHGTANALAWSSGVAKDPLHTLMNGRPIPVPIFEVTFSPGARLVTQEGAGRESIDGQASSENLKMYGAVVFSWGLHASLVARSDTAAYRKHGLERFKIVAQELLAENHAYEGVVKVRKSNPSRDNSDWHQLFPHDQSGQPPTASYIMVTLVSNLEENFRISPASTPLDPSLRLIAIPHLPPAEISRLLYLPYAGGQHVDDPNVTYCAIDGLHIDFLDGGESDEDGSHFRQVCIDGKIVEVEAGGWIELKMLPSSGMEGRRVIELVN